MAENYNSQGQPLPGTVGPAIESTDDKREPGRSPVMRSALGTSVAKTPGSTVAADAATSHASVYLLDALATPVTLRRRAFQFCQAP